MSLPISSISSSPFRVHSPARAGAGAARVDDNPAEVAASATYNLFAQTINSSSDVAATNVLALNDPALPTPPGTPKRDILKRKRMELVSASPSRFSESDKSRYIEKYQRINSQLWSERFDFRGMVCSLQYLGSGDFNDCFKIKAPHEMENYVIKTFHEVRMNRCFKRLHSMSCHAIEQFTVLKGLGIPVANILNADTAVADGYSVVEYVPEAIDPSIWIDKSFDELDHKTKEILGKVRSFFEAAFIHNLSLDLLPANLRVKANGELVITDFCEEAFDTDTFNAEICTRLKKWSNHRSVQEFLIETLPKEFQEHHRRTYS